MPKQEPTTDAVAGRCEPTPSARLDGAPASIGKEKGETDFAAPRARFAETAALPKIAREGLVMLVVETEHCPHVLPRVLTIVGDRGATAFTISTRRDGRIQRIDIEMAALGEPRVSLILQELRRLTNVRQARFGFPPYASHLPISAKL